MKNVARKIPKRVYCEDTSPTLRSIRNAKNNGKFMTINGDTYELVGSDMMYCPKTSRIVMLGV
jgi:hypothetical protein